MPSSAYKLRSRTLEGGLTHIGFLAYLDKDAIQINSDMQKDIEFFPKDALK